jgi:hypothetical protein
MNRSGRGFGLTGVAVAVVVMIVTAVFSTSAQSSEISFNQPTHISTYSACKISRD